MYNLRGWVLGQTVIFMAKIHFEIMASKLAFNNFIFKFEHTPMSSEGQPSEWSDKILKDLWLCKNELICCRSRLQDLNKWQCIYDFVKALHARLRQVNKEDTFIKNVIKLFHCICHSWHDLLLLNVLHQNTLTLFMLWI